MKRWGKYAAIALGIAAVLFAATFLFPEGYQACHPNDYTHAKECAPHHLGPVILLRIAYWADLHNGLVTAVATLAIAIFTIVLSKISVDQGRFSERALKINRQPFVFVDDYKPFYEIDPAATQPEDIAAPRLVSGWAFRPIWRNGGETQTRNLICHVDYEFRESPLPMGHKFTDNHPVATPMMLGPKSIGTGGNPRTFKVDEVERVKKSERFLYMWSWVRYGDAFDPTRHRITRCCIQVVVLGNPAQSSCTFQWLIHNEGNCSDDECAAVGLG